MRLKLEKLAELKREAANRGLRRPPRPRQLDFLEWQSDPVGFNRRLFGANLYPALVRLMESVRDNEVTIAKSANGVGKTFAAAHVAAWWYLCFPGSKIFTAAAPPEDNLRLLLWGELSSIYLKYPEVFRGHRLIDLKISNSPSHFITGVTIPASGTSAAREARFSGKHAPFLLFIIDEGDAVPDEVYRGIDSCMSGGLARLLVLFNPRSPAGPLYRRERERRGSIVELPAFEHPNVEAGNDLIPGAVSREVTVRRIAQWSRPLAEGEQPDGECFEVPEFLVGCVALDQKGLPTPPLAAGTRKITDPALSYMVLAKYPAQADNQLISREWIDAARMRWDEWVGKFGDRTFGRPKVGLDVAEFGADLNALARRYGNFVAPIRTWGGMDPLETGDLAAAICTEFNAEKIWIDGTGVGSPVAEAVRRAMRGQGNRPNGFEAFSVKVAVSPTERVEQGEFSQFRDQLFWHLREWLRRDAAMLPPDEALTEELAVPTYSIQNGKLKILEKEEIKKLIKRSPDRMEALMMTFAGELLPNAAVPQYPTAESLAQMRAQIGRK